MVDLGRVTSQGAPTLEVRWIRPGVLPTSAVEWVSRFLSGIESREDIYLVGEGAHGMSVKLRGGALLEVKVASEGRGILDVPGQARGRIQSWTRWSFPIPFSGEKEYDWPDWARVGKLRRIDWFSYADNRPTTVRRPPSADHEGTCAVEFTEVMRDDDPWWTIGFEATGHSDTARAAIEATAALVLRDPLPGGLELIEADSMSYSEWLRSAR